MQMAALLLNIDWDNVLKASVPADNVRGQEQYVSLNSVWKQLQTYYPNTEAYSKNGYSVYTVSDGGNYIQSQKRPDKNMMKVSMRKDGKVKTHSLTQKSILNNNFVSKNSPKRYFRKVWCEEYYLDNVPIEDTKYILATLKTADVLAEVEELRIQKNERAALREARNFIITGQGKHSIIKDVVFIFFQKFKVIFWPTIHVSTFKHRQLWRLWK